jgi:hypothetical protein
VRLEDVTGTSPTRHEPTGPAVQDLEDPHLSIQEDHRDRPSHPERLHAPAAPEEHRRSEARLGVTPQPTHPFSPRLRDQDAPLAAGPIHLDDLHAATVRSATDAISGGVGRGRTTGSRTRDSRFRQGCPRRAHLGGEEQPTVTEV